MGNASNHQPPLQTKQLPLLHPKMPIYQRCQTKQTLSIQFFLNSEKEYTDWMKEKEQNPGESLVGVLNPIRSSFEKIGMCGSSGIALIQYDHYPFNLKQKILSHQAQYHKKFKENFLWYLIYTLAAVASKFHSLGVKIGDIRPDNVFMNEEGQLKIGTKYTWPNEMQNYHKSLYLNEKCYLSPDEMENIKIGVEGRGFNKKDEVFSGGVTVLEVALLENSENIYVGKEIDYDLLEGKKQNLKRQNGYRDLLKHVILNMIEIQQENRICFHDLYQWLSNYSIQILNFDEFECSQVPSEILQTIQKNPIKIGCLSDEPAGFFNLIQNNPIIRKAKSNQLSRLSQIQKQNEKENISFQMGQFHTKLIESQQANLTKQSNKFQNKLYRHQSSKKMKVPKVFIQYMNNGSQSRKKGRGEGLKANPEKQFFLVAKQVREKNKNFEKNIQNGKLPSPNYYQ